MIKIKILKVRMVVGVVWVVMIVFLHTSEVEGFEVYLSR